MTAVIFEELLKQHHCVEPVNNIPSKIMVQIKPFQICPARIDCAHTVVNVLCKEDF